MLGAPLWARCVQLTTIIRVNHTHLWLAAHRPGGAVYLAAATWMLNELTV